MKSISSALCEKYSSHFIQKRTGAEENKGLTSYIIHGSWCVDSLIYAAAFVAWGYGNV